MIRLLMKVKWSFLVIDLMLVSTYLTNYKFILMETVFGNKPETIIYKTEKLKKVVNHVLLGTRLDVVKETEVAFEVDTRGRGKPGWVKKNDVRDTPILKIFFVDVGQGDGAIIESPEGIILLDGGPSSNFYKFLLHRYRKILRDQRKVDIKAIITSHPDWDHFNGLTAVIKDSRFFIDRIYHNGIIRYDGKPPGRNTEIGRTTTKNVNGKDRTVLTETFSTLSDAQNLIDDGHLMKSFTKFWQAAIDAKAQGRLIGAKCITIHEKTIDGYDNNPQNGLNIEILAPIPVGGINDTLEYVTFPKAEDIDLEDPKTSESHTINGHSIVLKLSFGEHSVLLGGDLNIPAEFHLLEHYGDENPFRVDVAKACHHGSSDYLVDYLKKVRPIVNVVSSGDNKSFDHPMSDAVGASCRHTRGNHPLFFSTELARAIGSSGTHYGLINLRSNGDLLVMAQMKEQHKKADVWDSYTVPWHGKFDHEIKEYKKKNP